ncbi:unnamed protein product [Lampetra planeri]
MERIDPSCPANVTGYPTASPSSPSSSCRSSPNVSGNDTEAGQEDVSSSSSFSSSASAVVLPLVYFAVCAVGLAGNTLVVYVVLRYAKMKTVTNVYILNLAIADELFMFGLPFLAIQNALSYWPFGSLACRIVMALDGVNQFTGIFCLTAMSVDRYVAVVHPARAPRWRRPLVAKTVNAAVWGLSILVALPLVVFSYTSHAGDTCNVNWPEPAATWSTAFIVYTTALGFFGPLTVICLCYLLIVVRVKSSGARVGAAKRRASERRVTLMVVVVVAVFVFCWLPFYALNIANLVVALPEEPALVKIYSTVVVLSYANSCANPILYAFLSDNFKKSFQKALRLRKSTRLARAAEGQSERRSATTVRFEEGRPVAQGERNGGGAGGGGGTEAAV